MFPQLRHYQELLEISEEPFDRRKVAETRFLLLKEFFDLFEKNALKLDCKYRRKAAISAYCQEKKVSVRTFYRWNSEYLRYGITGLLPRYRPRSKYQHASPKAMRAVLEIDPRHPLDCLAKLDSIIQQSPNISSQEKLSAHCFLTKNLDVINRRSPIRLPRKITTSERAILEKYKAEKHVRHRARATAILMADTGSSLMDIMSETGAAKRTIYQWRKSFLEKGVGFIKVDPMGDEKRRLKKVKADRLIEILHASPHQYDINRTSWSYDSLHDAYQEKYGEHISRHFFQETIRNSGYSWKRARKVLSSNDPHYKKKIRALIDGLHSIQENEAFFFASTAESVGRGR